MKKSKLSSLDLEYIKMSKFNSLIRNQNAYLKEIHETIEKTLCEIDPGGMARFFSEIPQGEYAAETMNIIGSLRRGRDVEEILYEQFGISIYNMNILDHLKLKTVLEEIKSELIRLRLRPLD